MAKKSFKDISNPADTYISSVDHEPVDELDITSLDDISDNDNDNDHPSSTDMISHNEIGMISTKIGSVPPPPTGYRINPIYIEKKNKSMHLLTRPTLYKKLKIRSRQLGISVNEYLNSIIAEDTKDIQLEEE